MGFYFTIALDNKIKSSGIYLANKYFTKFVMFLNNEPLECSKWLEDTFWSSNVDETKPTLLNY